MILLVSSEAIAEKCAPILQHEARTRVRAVSTMQQATTVLKDESFDAVVFDQSMIEVRPAALDAALRHAGSAIPVFVNPSVQSLERMVREVKSALYRRECEQKSAMESARRAVRNDMLSDVTAILLNTQLVLKSSWFKDGECAEAAEKMKSVCELAERLSKRLE